MHNGEKRTKDPYQPGYRYRGIYIAPRRERFSSRRQWAAEVPGWGSIVAGTLQQAETEIDKALAETVRDASKTHEGTPIPF